MSRLRFGGMALLCLVLAGCGDSAGPDEFDMVQMQADIDVGFEAEASPDNASIYEGLDQSDDILGSGGPVVSRTRWTAGAMPMLSRAGQPLSLSRGDLPDSVMGKTWEFDDVAGEYVASTRTDAPDDGARFILYAVDGAGAFASPLVEVGYLDFRELGNSERREGQLVAVVDDVTLYDLSGYATGAAGSGTFGATGFITFNGLRLEVDGTGSVQPSGAGSATELSTTITVPQHDVEIDGTVSDPGGSSNLITLTASVTSAAGQLDIAGTAGDNSSGDYATEFTFSLNGEEFATRNTVTGEPTTYTGLNGHVVSAEHEAFFEQAVDVPDLAAFSMFQILVMMTPVLEPIPLAF